MAGDMASLHAGLIQRTRKPSEEEEWQRSEEKKAAQDSVKEYIQGKREDVPASLSWLSKPAVERPPLQSQQPISHEAPAAISRPAAAPPQPAPAQPRPAPPVSRAPDAAPAPMAPKPAPPVAASPVAETQNRAPAIPETEIRASEIPSATEVFKPVNQPRPYGRTKARRKVDAPGKKKAEKRKALTLRLDMEEYERMMKARDVTGRTSQDILETALSVYLNLLSIDDD